MTDDPQDPLDRLAKALRDTAPAPDPGARDHALARAMEKRGFVSAAAMEDVNQTLKRMERFWGEQIRYIY